VQGLYCIACWNRRGSLAVPPIIEDLPGEDFKDCLPRYDFQILGDLRRRQRVPPSGEMSDGGRIATALERIAACMELSAAKEPR
jgi:hypothetical protein